MDYFSFVIISVVLFVFGAILGSFLNVVLYRTVIGKSWLWGRSRCDLCLEKLAWYDNVPLLSYVVLRARCRHCQEPIALSHPVIELLTGILFVWWWWGGSLFFQLTQTPFQSLQPLFWLSVGVLLIMVAMADLLYMVIPDIAVGLLFGLTVAYRLALVATGIMQYQDLGNAVLAMTVITIIFWSLWFFTRGKGFGLGDVKLIVPLSLLMGWPKIMVGLFAAFVTGAVVGLVMIALRKRKLGQVIPFGPFLIVGTVISLLIGDEIMTWYLSLL